MQLKKLITLADKNVEEQFLAMQRSLRATGCELPVWVIPYSEELFDLPKNCSWWAVDEIIGWLNDEKAHPMMRKYQCLTTDSYQFVDSDICFLQNPEQILTTLSGFIVCCGHWRNPIHTCTSESQEYFSNKSTNWQKYLFNAGQFACDRVLYDIPTLINTANQPKFRWTCVDFPFHDQPGLNMLVADSGVCITNLTLPPFDLESSWAGDYLDDYERFWSDTKRSPYMIHWAGIPIVNGSRINELFRAYLSELELAEFDKKLMKKNSGSRSVIQRLLKKVGIPGRFP